MTSLEFSKKGTDSFQPRNDLSLLNLVPRDKQNLQAGIPTENSSTTGARCNSSQTDKTPSTSNTTDKTSNTPTKVPTETPVVQPVTPKIPTETPVVQPVTPKIPTETPVVQPVTPKIPTETPVVQPVTTKVPTETPVVQPVTPKIPTETPVVIPVPTETIHVIPAPYSVFQIPGLVPPIQPKAPEVPTTPQPPPPPPEVPTTPQPPPPPPEVPTTPQPPPTDHMCRIPTRAFTGEGDLARVQETTYQKKNFTPGHSQLLIPKIGLDLEVDPSGLGSDVGDKKHATEWVTPKDKHHLGRWSCDGQDIPGKILINGHVTLTDKQGHTGPGPLFELHKLKDGDQVILENPDGSKSTYKMIGSEVIKPNENQKWSRLFSPGDPKHPELDIVTCTGPYIHGYHRDNLVDRFEQVGIEPEVRSIQNPIPSKQPDTKLVDNSQQTVFGSASQLGGPQEIGIGTTGGASVSASKVGVPDSNPQQPKNEATLGIAFGQTGQVFPNLEIEHQTSPKTTVFAGTSGEGLNLGASYYPIKNRNWTVGAIGEVNENASSSPTYNNGTARSNPGLGVEGEVFGRRQWNDFGLYAATKYATNPSQLGFQAGAQWNVRPGVNFNIGEQYSSVNFLDQTVTPEVKYSPALYTVLGVNAKLSEHSSVGLTGFVGPQSGGDLRIKFDF